MNITMLDAAHQLHHADISVVPVMADGSKRPEGTWKHYQKSRATLEEIRSWFAQPGPGIGVVTGAVSGNLEMTEIEADARPRLGDIVQMAAASGLEQLWTKIAAGWVELSPTGGLHWFYRVTEPIPGNTKIAMDSTRKKVLAETRGEGGFVVTAPSGGTVHPNGGNWVRMVNGPARMPTLTMAERDDFHRLLTLVLDEPRPEPVQQAFPVNQADPFAGGTGLPNDPFTAGTTPGDDFETKTSWKDILVPAGWTYLYQHGTTSYWRRPGKKDGAASATTGHDPERDRLYVFSSSTEFDTETPYTKFGAYALINHGGDHSRAASELRKLGHGSAPKVAAPPPLRSVTSAPQTTQQLPENVVDLTARREAQQAAAVAVAEPAPQLQRIELNNDDGNALALVALHGNRIRYNPDRDRWLYWTGNVWEWQPKRGGAVRELAKEAARLLPEDSVDQRKHKKYSLNATGISNALAQAETDPRVVVATDALDAHPWELNTPGGIIDLRTGMLHYSDPAKLHTRLTSCAPDFNADQSRLKAFLADTFPGRDNLVSYLQRLIGYSAVGEVTAHVLPLLIGNGGNGKSVLLETIAHVLGDYATSAPNGFLMSAIFQKHETEIADLAGARFVICSEVNEEDKFDEAKVKKLTGGDTLKGRFMRQDYFTFKPTHHLWLAANYLPAVESGGDSFWRRVRNIPFEHTVPEEKIVENLTQILAVDHGPAVLAWIAQGAAEFHRRGLMEPAEVKAATADYQATVDTVGRFLDECCHTGDGASGMSVLVTALRAAYDKWCMQNGEKPVQGRAFSTQLARHGVAVGKAAPRGSHGGGRRYGGIGLVSPRDEDDPFGEEREKLDDQGVLRW